jgi:hypothetical protein
MDEHAPSPHTTLAILFGASAWPDSPDFHGSAAFANVARDFRAYLLNPQQFGLPEENFLDLFDTEQGPHEIDRAIRTFLDQRTAAMRQGAKRPALLLRWPWWLCGEEIRVLPGGALHLERESRRFRHPHRIAGHDSDRQGKTPEVFHHPGLLLCRCGF